MNDGERQQRIEEGIEAARKNFLQPQEPAQKDISFTMTTDLEAKVIRVDFGAPVAWLAFPPDFARVFAKALLDRVILIEEEQEKKQEAPE
jgi:hypothetical protein